MKLTKTQLREQVELWNARYPVGTAVLYTHVAASGETRIEYTRSKAAIAAGSTAVVWITGHWCAVAIAWLTPHPELPRRTALEPLLRTLHAFRPLLLINPLMAVNRLALQAVVFRGLDPHAPDFPVLSLHVLEGEYYLGAIVQAEGIQQFSDVVCGHDALDAIVRLRFDSELGSEFVRRSKLPYLHRRRRRWWRVF
ncbi:MAG TPA: hypothetical protein VKT75_05790 [Acidobacteriaceae bacterium]|nr:hypothetical protein [Acidobacteriaceae bacterium]